MCRPCLYTAHVYRDDVTLNLGRYYIYGCPPLVVFFSPLQNHKSLILPLYEVVIHRVQNEQGVRLVSLMQREIILYMASAIFVSSYLADFYLLSKFASLE
jgi:hypothetical protein